MRSKHLLACLLTVWLVSCSTTKPTPIPPPQVDACSVCQVVGIQKLAVQTAATAIIALHTQKQVSDSVYTQAQTAYSQWYNAENLLSTALVAWNDGSSGDQFALAGAVTQAATQALVAYISFMQAYGPKSGVKPETMQAASPAPKACIITDDQIRSQLTPATWQSLGGQ